MPPLLSVVIPTFNRRTTLARVLDALLEQRPEAGAAVEIVVVDDGSTDGTGDVLAARAAVVSLSQPNGGPARARNRGAAAATGERLLFLGDDTVPERGFLAVHAGETRPGIAVLGYTGWDAERMRVTPLLRHLNENGLQFGYAIIPDAENVPFNFFYTSNVSLDRRLFLDLGGFDESFPFAAFEDVELAYRAMTAGRLRMVYRKAARTRHDHPTTLASFRGRQRRAGQAGAVFAAKHPELEAWIGLPEARRIGDRRPLSVSLLAAVTETLDPLGVPLPGSAYDKVLRWDYLQGLRSGGQ